MASRMFQIFDIRKMDKPAQERESSLKFLTRALACMVDGQGASLLQCFQKRKWLRTDMWDIQGMRLGLLKAG